MMNERMQGSGNVNTGRQDNHKAWTLRSLTREDDSALTATIVTNRLIALMHSQPADSRMTVTWTGVDGRVDVRIDAVRMLPDFGGDLRWVSGNSHEWVDCTDEEVPRPLQVRRLALTAPTATDPDLGWDTSHMRHKKTTWPEPLPSDSQLLMTTLNQVGGIVRIHIAPATAVEAEMLTESFLSTEQVRADESLALYLGTPMRLTVLLGSESQRDIPARLTISLRDWIRPLGKLIELGPETTDRTWQGEDLEGAVVPEALVAAFLRLPVAGGTPRVLGMPVRHRMLTDVPLAEEFISNDGLRIGRAVDPTGRDVDVLFDRYGALQHLEILGASGTGKSTLSAQLAHSFARADRGGLILDPHGRLVDRILRELPPEAAERALVIRHADLDHPVPLNLFTSGDFETVCAEYIDMFYALFDPQHTGIVGPRFERVFRQMAAALHALFDDELPLTLLPTLLNDKMLLRRAAEAVARSNPQLSREIRGELVDNSSQEYPEVVAWVSAKIERLVRTPYMRAIMGTGKDALDMEQAMKNRRIVLVDLASPTIGRAQAQMLGMLWLNKVGLAMATRHEDEPPFHVIVDEAHLFQDCLLAQMLAEGRKFSISVTFAHQHMGQLSRELRDAAEGNASSVVAFRTSIQDAPMVVERVGRWTGGSLSRLPNQRAVATLATPSGQCPAFTLNVDHNERVADRQERGELDPTVPNAVVKRSMMNLVYPFVDARVKGESELNDALTRARRGTSDHTGVHQPSQLPPPGSFLDDWLRKRDESRIVSTVEPVIGE